MIKRIIACLILLTLLCLAPLRAQADVFLDDLNRQIKAKQDTMKQLEDKIATYKKSIEVKQGESLSLNNQLALLDSRVVKTGLDIQLAQAEIDALNLEIESLETIIKEKEANIAKHKSFIANLLRQIHIGESRDYLKVLILSSSFSEYFNQTKYLESLNADLVRTLRQVKSDKNEIEAKQKISLAKKDRLTEVKNTLSDRRASLEEQEESKKYLLKQTKLSENKFRLLLAQLRQEYSAFDQEMAALQRRVESELASSNKLESDGNLSLTWPIVHDRGISAYFRDQTYPFRFLFEHSGLDIKASQGTQVYAPASGYVAWVRSGSRGYGNSIMVIHNNGVATLYAHLSRFSVSEDNFVKRGDLLGYSGGTPGTPGAGFSTGPHLHFEVRENGLPVDPLGYLMR